MSKKLQYMVVHWSATGREQDVTMSDLHRWHIEQKGWSRYGYSDLIQLSGKVINITPYDNDAYVQQHEMTWGALGINAISRHICLVGGVDQPISPRQYASLLRLVAKQLELTPDIKVIGHDQANATMCPGFDVPSWCEANGISRDNYVIGKIPEYNA